MIYAKGLQEGKVSSDIRKIRVYFKDGKDEDKKSKSSTTHRYDKLHTYIHTYITLFDNAG